MMKEHEKTNELVAQILVKLQKDIPVSKDEMIAVCKLYFVVSDGYSDCRTCLKDAIDVLSSVRSMT